MVAKALFGHAWVQVAEDGRGAVFKSAEGDVPLSRRPRERFELFEDGSATLYSAGADDRPVEKPASWQLEDGDIVIRPAGAAAADATTIRIIAHAPDELIVRR